MSQTHPTQTTTQRQPFKPIESEPVKICAQCSKVEGELYRCSRCKKVYYCGIDCQKAHWPGHKPACKGATKPTDKPKVQQQKDNNDALKQFGKLTHIGTGNFSTIYKAVCKQDGQVYAIKQVQKTKVQRMRKEADVYMQKHCLNKLGQCGYVVKLYKTFQDELNLYFKMELPEKGEIWQHSKIFGIVPESVYQYYVSHIVKAVSILHNQYQIVHRDLKPENILLDGQNRVKLIDFGTAKDLSRPDLKGSGNGLKGKKPFQHYVGTAHYMAPECIHNKASDKKSDIYSLSGVFYFLRVGSPPFQGGSEYLTFTKSLQTELLTCPELFDEALRDLIKRMNSKQMDKRIDIDQVIKHPYFAGTNFQQLPTYAQALESITQQQKYLLGLTENLKNIMQAEKEPKVERRQQIYDKQVTPLLQAQKQKHKQNQALIKKLIVIDIQCQSFLNLRDNSDVSFTEIYNHVIHGVKIKSKQYAPDDQ